MVDEVVVQFVACYDLVPLDWYLMWHRTRTIFQDQPNQILSYDNFVESSDVWM